jgi:hypothetical protein
MGLSLLCWWIRQTWGLTYRYHHRSLLPPPSGQFKTNRPLGLSSSWRQQAPPKQLYLYTNLHCIVSQKTGIVNLPYGTRINSEFNLKNARIYTRAFNFSMQTLTQRKQKPKEKLQRDHTRVAKTGWHIHCIIWKFNPPPCKAMYVLLDIKGSIAFSSHNLPV